MGRDDRVGGWTPATALRTEGREARAVDPLGEFDEALEEAWTADAPSLSAEAVAMPSEVPTPRKIANAPTRPMYLEYPAEAFSVRVDGLIAPPTDHELRGGQPEDVAGITDGTANLTDEKSYRERVRSIA